MDRLQELTRMAAKCFFFPTKTCWVTFFSLSCYDGHRPKICLGSYSTRTSRYPVSTNMRRSCDVLHKKQKVFYINLQGIVNMTKKKINKANQKIKSQSSKSAEPPTGNTVSMEEKFTYEFEPLFKVLQQVQGETYVLGTNPPPSFSYDV